MAGMKLLIVAFCVLSTFAAVKRSAAQTSLTYYTTNLCNTPMEHSLDLTAALVGYVGPPPPVGHQLCLIDRTRLLACTNLNDPVTTVAGVACTANTSAVCPSIKGVQYGYNCVLMAAGTHAQVPEGNKLCVGPTGDAPPVACKDIRLPWAGTFFSKGVFRGTKEEEEKKEESKMEEDSVEFKDEKLAEFFPKYPQIPDGEQFHTCWFLDGAIQNCANNDLTTPWVPTPYPGFTGWYLPQVNTNTNQGFVTGSVTLEGIQTAFAGAISFFANAILV